MTLVGHSKKPQTSGCRIQEKRPNQTRGVLLVRLYPRHSAHMALTLAIKRSRASTGRSKVNSEFHSTEIAIVYLHSTEVPSAIPATAARTQLCKNSRSSTIASIAASRDGNKKCMRRCMHSNAMCVTGGIDLVGVRVYAVFGTASRVFRLNDVNSRRLYFSFKGQRCYSVDSSDRE